MFIPFEKVLSSAPAPSGRVTEHKIDALRNFGEQAAIKRMRITLYNELRRRLGAVFAAHGVTMIQQRDGSYFIGGLPEPALPTIGISHVIHNGSDKAHAAVLQNHRRVRA